MTAKTLDTLVALDPASKIVRTTVASACAIRPGSALHAQAMEAFLSRYVRLAFGWYIAGQFALHRLPFPIPMTRRNAWVFKAYLMRLDPYMHYDKHVADAFHMAQTTQGVPKFGATLKAALICYDGRGTPQSHLAGIANVTGAPYKSIEAFESLFYNTLDRRADAMYIANEVYPETRIVEFDEAYFQNSTLGDLLKRAGYNHKDLSLTAYLAGIGDRSYMAKVAASDNREAELAKHIMGNGLMLSRTNLLNQRSVGLSRSTMLMAASRQSGTAPEDPALAAIGQSFSDQLRAAVNVSQQNTIDMVRADEGFDIFEPATL